MKNLKNAIKLARDNGWEKQLPKFVPNTTIISNPDLLDPNFFKALGKGLRWEVSKKYWTMENEVAVTLLDRWENEMHSFIQHLIEGKTTESFFEELLK